MGLFHITIRRSRLGRGLLLAEGKLCCLGHICRAAEIPLQELEGNGCLWQISERYWGNLPLELQPYRDRRGDPTPPPLGTQIMQVNDDESLSSADREFHLRRLAATAGIELIFEGG